MKSKLGVMTAIVVATAFGSTAHAVVLTTILNDTNGTDNFLYNNSPASNFAGSGIFYYDERGAGLDMARPVIGFDLPVLPLGATINSVELRLKIQQYTFIDVNNGNATVPHSFAVHQMLVPWDETTSNWTDSSTGTLWNSPGLGAGADYNAVAEDATVVSGADVNQYVSWDITSLVQAWYDGLTPNYGLHIHGPAGDPLSDTNGGDVTDGVFRVFNTEFADDNVRPLLVIDYVPEPASVSLLLCGGLFAVMNRRKK